jgi:hypothetical protein
MAYCPEDNLYYPDVYSQDDTDDDVLIHTIVIDDVTEVNIWYSAVLDAEYYVEVKKSSSASIGESSEDDELPF